MDKPEPLIAEPHADDLTRMRALLRLLVAEDLADYLALDIARMPNSREAMERLQQLLRWQAGLAWFRRLNQRKEPSAPPLLAPGHRLPTRAALALGLHVGLDRPLEDLAHDLATTPDELGRDLFRARAAIDPDLARASACPDFVPLLGRYRDTSLSMSDRADLIIHVQRCPACAEALAASRRADEALSEQIAAIEAALPAAAPWPRWRRLPPTGRALRLLQVGLAIVLLVAAVGFVAELQAVGGRSTPVPAVSAATAPLQGWLVYTGANGGLGLEALNLGTGEQWALGPALPDNLPSPPVYLLSPNGRLLATWTLTGSKAPFTGTLTITDLKCGSERVWRWPDEPGGRTPVAWLTDSTILFVVGAPLPTRNDPNQAFAIQARGNQLVSLDLTSGAEHVLLQGSVSDAIPSPDGRKIALIEVHDPRWQENTLELRAITGGELGPPIATVEHRVDYASPVWSPDSRYLYFSLIPDNPAVPTATPGTSPAPIPRFDLLRVDRLGHLSTLVAASPGEQITPLGVSPDGQRVIYQRGLSVPGRTYTTSLWEVDADGASPSRLTADAPLFTTSITWSPDGQTLALARLESLNLSTPSPNVRPEALATDLITLGPGGEQQVVAQTAVYSAGGGFLRWLPPDALAPPAPPPKVTIAARLAPPTPLSLRFNDDRLELNAGSRVSPDGHLVILSDRSIDRQIVWQVAKSIGLTLSTEVPVTDISWFPDGSAAIGVAPAPQPGPGHLIPPSWIALLSQPPSFQLAQFDPAGIATSNDQYYALPLVAPGGALISFFVVDRRDGSVALWLARGGVAARSVAQWSIPAGARLPIPPAAAWIDQHTLLFTVPSDWRNGLPQEVVFRRLSVGPAGALSVDSLVTIGTHGSERGIVLADLLLSPDRQQLAYRLHHYTQVDPSRGSFDTVDTAPVTNLAAPLELARADPGEGLSWSPDSRWLAAGLQGRIRLLAIDGRAVREATPPGASNPLWVGPEEIWYAQTIGNETRVMRLRLDK